MGTPLFRPSAQQKTVSAFDPDVKTCSRHARPLNRTMASSIFDSIRIKPTRKAEEAKPTTTPCAHAGCLKPGEFKAPKGRDYEGEFFSFCAEHVRAYNATYDYFKGMDDAALAKFRTAEVVGHRPTWKMGQGNAKHVDESMFANARSMRRKGVKSRHRRCRAALQHACAQGADDA
jgi:hypothetical protein